MSSSHARRAAPRKTRSVVTREDVAVAESVVVCAVCHRLRTRGAHSLVGDVFVCAECQADAAQFIDIQDSGGGEADQAADATRNRDASTTADR